MDHSKIEFTRQSTYRSKIDQSEYCYINFIILQIFSIDMFFIGISKIVRSKNDSLLKSPIKTYEIYLSRFLAIPAIAMYAFIMVYSIGLVLAIQSLWIPFKAVLLFLFIVGLTFGMNVLFKYFFTRYLPKIRGWEYLP